MMIVRAVGMILLLSPATWMVAAAERGIGGVLLDGKIPRKAVALSTDVRLRIPDDAVPGRMVPGIPYFVFEDNGDELLVWHLQDEETARTRGGWAKTTDIVEWASRRLCYPRRGSDIDQVLRLAFSDAGGLPTYEATAGLPWPIVNTTDSPHSYLVLCDLSAFGGATRPLTLRGTADVDIYLMFSEAELDRIFQALAAAKAAIGKDRSDLSRLHEALSLIVAQCRVEFLELRDIERAIEAFPGGRMSFLAKREYLELVSRAEAVIDEHLRWVSQIGRTKEFKNEEHQVMIVPKSWLDGLTRGAK